MQDQVDLLLTSRMAQQEIKSIKEREKEKKQKRRLEHMDSRSEKKQLMDERVQDVALQIQEQSQRTAREVSDINRDAGLSASAPAKKPIEKSQVIKKEATPSSAGKDKSSKRRVSDVDIFGIEERNIQERITGHEAELARQRTVQSAVEGLKEANSMLAHQFENYQKNQMQMMSQLQNFISTMMENVNKK